MVVHPLTLIKDEAPKFNGQEVKSIYAVYENSRYADGGYIADILFYNVYVKAYDKENWRSYDKILKVKVLPEPFQRFMGKIVTNRTGKVFIRNFTIRQSGSGNGGFVDESIDISGWNSNATIGTYGFFRGNPKMDTNEYHYVVNSDTDLYKTMMEDIVGKSFEVEEIDFYQCGSTMKEGTLDFATKYPYKHTPIQIIDSMVYCDEKLPSWRWLHGMPYRRPTDAKEGDNTNIRVWDNDLKQHVYLQKATDLEIGGDNLVQVTFSYKSHDLYGNEGRVYCNIRRYIAEHGHEYVRFNVTKKTKAGEFKGRVSNPKNKFNEREETLYPSDLYYITRIVQSQTHTDENND